MRCSNSYNCVTLPNGRQVATDLQDVDLEGFNFGKMLKGVGKAVGGVAKMAGGIIPGPIGAAVGAAGNIVGKVSKIGDKKKGGAPAAPPSQKATTTVGSAVGRAVPSPTRGVSTSPSSSNSEIKAMLNDLKVLVRAGMNKDDAKFLLVSALKEFQADRDRSNKQINTITGDVVSKVDPALGKIVSMLNKKELQQQATYEHNTINKNEARWRESQEAHKKILQKLDLLDKKTKVRFAL